MPVQNDQHKRDKKGSRDDNGGIRKIMHVLSYIKNLYLHTHIHTCACRNDMKVQGRVFGK